jgi:hypothetical protein
MSTSIMNKSSFPVETPRPNHQSSGCKRNKNQGENKSKNQDEIGLNFLKIPNKQFPNVRDLQKDINTKFYQEQF